MSRMIEGRNHDEWIDTSSHSERDIFNGCVEIMAGVVDDFKEWYLWMHGDDALDCISEDELFEIQYPTSETMSSELCKSFYSISFLSFALYNVLIEIPVISAV